MNAILLDQIVSSVLYEGHILYPYRANLRQTSHERFTAGRVYPEGYSQLHHSLEPSVIQTECLLIPTSELPELDVSVRFLQPLRRKIASVSEGCKSADESVTKHNIVPSLTVAGQTYQPWQEAAEREIALGPIILRSKQRNSIIVPFQYPAVCSHEHIRDEHGRVRGLILRNQEAVSGMVEIKTTPVKSDLIRVTVRLLNDTPIDLANQRDYESVAMQTFVSTHTILHAKGADFVSSMNTPAEYASTISACKNIGTWPVLIGDESRQEHDTMLSAPACLPDYPKVASRELELPDLEGEIDELAMFSSITLSVRDEPSIVAKRDVVPTPFELPGRVTTVSVGGAELKPGDRVRLRSKHPGNTDILLDGRTAVIQALEEDKEHHIHIAVVLETGDDQSRSSRVRFLYELDDVEPLKEAAA